MSNLWETASVLPIQTGKEITGGFTIDFDREIPEATKDILMRFAYWVEDRYSLPVTLWVDFKHRHYLLASDRKRVPYRFYWAEFATYPVFDNYDDIPVIELAVRTGKQTNEEILEAFIEAISHYFAWLSCADMRTYKPDKKLTEEILRAYKDFLR